MAIEDKLGGENKGLEQSVNTSYEPQAVPERIADIYFKPKSFERSCKLYERLGVKYFKKFLMGTYGWLLKFGKKHSVYNSTYFIGPDRSNKSLMRFEKYSRFNECVHSPLMALFTYKVLDDLGNGNHNAAISDVFWLALNAYCTFLQRYNRARIYNTIEGTEGPKVWAGKTSE